MFDTVPGLGLRYQVDFPAVIQIMFLAGQVVQVHFKHGALLDILFVHDNDLEVDLLGLASQISEIFSPVS